ncbi:MAG TPA: hypothetical protein VNA20_10560 [Frankiaceae bacterium]|nr:hypothetical protein [Frankiaceae bacterium]
MRTSHRHTRTAVVAGLAIALATAACGRDDKPQPVPAPEPPAAPTVIVAIPDLPDVEVEPTSPATPSPSPTGDDSVDLRVTGNETLDDLFWVGDPKGTGPQIALRFLRAVQQRDYLAAAQQLNSRSRLALSNETMSHLRRVMDDVHTNAKLEGAGRCTSASEVTRTSAVVRCGTRRVVVHVESTSYYAGVNIHRAHPPYDVYRGPHTHAYTGLDL